jgi:MscS family membrane protein
MSVSVYGVELWDFGYALLAILGGFILKWLTTGVLSRLSKIADKTKVKFDDIILKALDRPLGWAFVLGGVYVAIVLLPFPEKPVDVERFLLAVCTGLATVIGIWFCLRLVDGFGEYFAAKAAKTKSKLDDQIVPIVRRSLKVFLVLLGGVVFLQNLGYSVGSLLAGVGIGGAAIAFAAKDMLANFFGVLVIFLDKPFQIGDWIEVAGEEGTVEEIGLRVTKIRTFANSVITIPNHKFTDGVVNNWSQMRKRRIKMTVGVTYDTKPEQVDDLVEKIRQLIRDDEKIHSDFFLVNFDAFGSSSLDVFVYCFTKTTDWAGFLDAKQAFMLEIMRLVEGMGLEMAFPTSTVHVASMPDEPKAMTRQRPV